MRNHKSPFCLRKRMKFDPQPICLISSPISICFGFSINQACSFDKFPITRKTTFLFSMTVKYPPQWILWISLSFVSKVGWEMFFPFVFIPSSHLLFIPKTRTSPFDLERTDPNDWQQIWEMFWSFITSTKFFELLSLFLLLIGCIRCFRKQEVCCLLCKSKNESNLLKQVSL